MKRLIPACAVAGLFLPFAVLAQTPSPTPAVPAAKEQVVVSATRGSEIETEIPGQVHVISGEQLRRDNVTNLADAIQDIVGIDTGQGSDNGTRLPNIGMWGLKEFDALLVMVDGVPVGGPFNPSLSQINIEDVDHIEIVKGPQGTLYGVSAFAGMIQVFTRGATEGGELRVLGGSFSEGRVSGSYGFKLGSATLRAFGTFDRTTGWQDRTDFKDDRGGIRLDAPLSGGGTFSATFNMLRNTQFFGSPLPVDPPTGETIPGFQIDRNYEVDGARLDHRIYNLATKFTRPLSSATVLENVLSVTRDDQTSIQTFIEEVDGNQATAAGTALKPQETDFYDDLHLSTTFEAGGHHRLVGGAAVTWGRTTASGTGFDIDLQIDPVVVPTFSETPPGDHRSFEDRRTFFGVYVNDEWTPIRALTVTGGARFDSVSESLTASIQEVTDPEPTVTRDQRSDGQWSGGLSVLGRVVEDHPGVLNQLYLYGAAKSAFKPAAPNLTDPANATILKPERTRSQELGVKTRWFDRQVSFDLSLFHMIMENLVVSNVDANGNPILINAGSERFQGGEIEVGFHPSALPSLAVYGGYAHHDARYIHFSFIDPDNGLTVADGQRLELVPRDLWNAKIAWQPGKWPGVWVAVRHQNHRPFDKINEAYMDPFYEWDAGASWSFGHWFVSLVGRNLGNSRHFVAESEIGDAQLYVAPPRRVAGELGVRF